ncbi:MAG TPA: right-handed parallel beta-helix repeat-containing protein, partial [Gemmatimonadaceae bacterium]
NDIARAVAEKGNFSHMWLALLWIPVAALVGAPLQVPSSKFPVPLQQPVPLTRGMVITRNTTVRPGTYRLKSASIDTAVVVIRGDNITVNLTGVTMAGAGDDDDPDQAAGLAILVDGGSNVTIRGAHIRGYKVAIMARGTRDLRLVDNDLSFNWKPRLYSGVEHESLVDWLSYHHNEKDEWLRYGAAIYLRGVKGGEIKGNTVTQGMNALLATETDSVLVWNNDFSFNSGLGIGLYRSSHNRILHNRVDYNVRGYSEGFYRRGQDSAGILIYEQSDSNVVAYNSATHSGDGLFLWAGQHTMDTGEGGANDNVFYKNDFSFAPTNAMEATFSRNAFVDNIARGSDYGLWGGYSFNSLVAGNTFALNRIGLAIEHGQDNQIVNNTFDGDSTSISLWANKVEPSDWVYPKKRDTRSRDYSIADNTLKPKRAALRIRDTQNAHVERNAIAADSALVIGGDTTGFALISDTARRPKYNFAKYRVAPMPGGLNASAHELGDLPRSTIVVDEWGPFDWMSPKLWPADSTTGTNLRLRVLGPRGQGEWRLLRARGAAVSRPSGKVGETFTVRPSPGPVEDWDIALEYRGRATRSPRGVAKPAGAGVIFTYARFDPRATWDVKVFAWNDSTNPVTRPATFDELLSGKRDSASLSFTSRRIDYMWYRPRIAGWPADKYGVRATTEVTLPPGEYSLRTISDDGIRVWVDDALVIDRWSVHESAVTEASIAPGRHRIRVDYFQDDGWAELRVEVVKK